MPPRDARRRFAGGFTLLEVIAVLAVLGVLAAVVLTRFGTGNVSAVTEAEIFKACLRYAQTRAMGDISTWGVSIAADGRSYTLFTNNPSVGTPVLPGVGSATRTLPAGVSVSVSGAVGAANSIVFDFRGRPVDKGGSGDTANGREYQKQAVANWPAALARDITLTFSGEGAVAVVVRRQTGFAQ